jgi:hypothetical protein
MTSGLNHALLVLVPPSIVPKMNVTIVAQFVVVGVVPPLESPHDCHFSMKIIQVIYCIILHLFILFS